MSTRRWGRPEEAARLYRRALLLLQAEAQDEAGVRLALARALLDRASSRPRAAMWRRSRPRAAERRRISPARRHPAKAWRQGSGAGAYRRAFTLNPAQVGLYLALRNQLRAQGAAPDEAEDLLNRAETYNPTEATWHWIAATTCSAPATRAARWTPIEQALRRCRNRARRGRPASRRRRQPGLRVSRGWRSCTRTWGSRARR